MSVTDRLNTFWKRLSALMEESGDNPSSLSEAIGAKSRDTVRQVGLRAEKKPNASLNAVLTDRAAKRYNVSVRWLLNGGPDRGVYAPLGEELATAARSIGVRQSIIDEVLAALPDAEDPWPSVQVMVARESAARAMSAAKPVKK